MEKTNLDVRRINASLNRSRYELHNLEQGAKKSISSEVDSIRTSLKRADHRVENVSGQTSSFVLQLEDVANASVSVNMKPQMIWLRDELDCIIRDLDAAQTNATSAIQCTDYYVYQVMDLNQEVESESNRLTNHHQTVESLLSKARSDVLQSEEKLRSTQLKISANEREISTKTADAESKRRVKASLGQQVAAKQAEINRARYEQKERKEQALIGGGVALFGLLAAPFTFGTSLVLTGAGAATSAYKTGRMIDFENAANHLQSSVNTVNNEISENTRAIARLEQEKTQLQAEIRLHRAEIVSKKLELAKLEQQVKETIQTQSEISTLKGLAASTTINAKNALPGLRNIRNNLEQCGDLVKERSVDVEISKELADRMVAVIPFIGTNLKRRRDYQKQVQAMQQVLETLEKIHAKIPTLLPSGNVKFLDVKPWNDERKLVSVSEMAQDMPRVNFFAA